MKVIYLAGSRKQFADMDWEAQAAVRHAVAMVKDKVGFRAHMNEVWRDCRLEVVIGHNIYTTDIRIVPSERERVGRPRYINGSAIYVNGAFWAPVSRVRVELI